MSNIIFGERALFLRTSKSRNYFDQQLRKCGLFARLEEMGIQDGDTVDIYDFEFEYQR